MRCENNAERKLKEDITFESSRTWNGTLMAVAVFNKDECFVFPKTEICCKGVADVWNFKWSACFRISMHAKIRRIVEGCITGLQY